jgi:hypothetical protein
MTWCGAVLLVIAALALVAAGFAWMWRHGA